MEEAAEEMMEEFLLKMRQAHTDQIPIKKTKALLGVGTPVTRVLEVAGKKQVGMIIIISMLTILTFGLRIQILNLAGL